MYFIKQVLESLTVGWFEYFRIANFKLVNLSKYDMGTTNDEKNSNFKFHKFASWRKRLKGRTLKLYI